MDFTASTIADLSARDMVEIFELRARVFVVEQNCVYLDPTAEDLHSETVHVLLRQPDRKMLAYVRLLPPGLDGPDPVIGRVVSDGEHRREGLGHRLMERALEEVEVRWPGRPIRLHAQVYLLDFYRRHGFSEVGDPYPLDGIPHQEMSRG